jgi:hypothetical protein
MREQTVANKLKDGAPSYQPQILGWRMSPDEAIWDWPATHAPPLGSESLLLSAGYPANAGLW